MGHSNTVRSVSWSPCGGHIASGFDDGTILIRKAENGENEVGPIETGQGHVRSLDSGIFTVWPQNCIRRELLDDLHLGQQHRRGSCRPDQRPWELLGDIRCVVLKQAFLSESLGKKRAEPCLHWHFHPTERQ